MQLWIDCLEEEESMERERERQRSGGVGLQQSLLSDAGFVVTSKRKRGGRCKVGDDEAGVAWKRCKGGDGVFGLRKNGFLSSNLTTQILQRELVADSQMRFATRNSREMFRGLKPRARLDAHDEESSDVKLCFLRRRSKVVEIVAAKDLLFGLTQTGVCTAFHRDTKRRVCFLNTAPDEVIRSLFYNKSNESLITVSVFREDNYSSLNCRSTPLRYIRNRNTEEGFALFQSESLRWPGFVEFDDVNGKVLTYSAKEKIYKVWGLENYNLLYSIQEEGIQEIKISPGIMLLIYERSNDFVHLKIVAIETGEVLKSFKHQLDGKKKVDFIEQFNEKLLVKQDGGNLEIFDVHTGERNEVLSTDFLTPTAFIFLYESLSFLTFLANTVRTWDFRGDPISRFEDHILWHPDCNTNNIYITSRQDLIVSYCKSAETGKGSINVSEIATGKCLAKIEDSTHGKALQDVTALYYNEDLNEIYTGTKSGHIYAWR